MREFSQRDKRFIMRHQDNLSLEEMAWKFKCDWKEVYEAYSEIIRTEEYVEYTNKRKGRMIKVRRGVHGNNSEENSGSEERFDYEFFDKTYNICGYRTIPTCVCKMYWK